MTGNVGTGPIAAAAITGFDLALQDGGAFSKSTQVTGNVYAADYVPSSAMMTQAVLDMEAAYTDAAGRVAPQSDQGGYIDLGAGIIEGMTLTPGLYKWVTGVSFTSSLTFDAGYDAGGADKVWILQIAGPLVVGAGAIVTLTDGALPENIFWQVAGSTTLHTTAHMQGIILCATNIVFQAGSSLVGAALAQTAVTLDAATVDKPNRSCTRFGLHVQC